MSVIASVGLGYGIVLAFSGFLAAGFGHGTYVLMGLSSAPLGLAQDVPIALAGAPLLWSLAAFLACGPRHWVWRALFLGILVAHYASLYWILNRPSRFADWASVPKVAVVFWPGVVFYVAGQAVLWGLFLFRLWPPLPRTRQGRRALSQSQGKP